MFDLLATENQTCEAYAKQQDAAWFGNWSAYGVGVCGCGDVAVRRCRIYFVESGSWTRLLAPSPLRTVLATFTAHGSSLCKGIFRHPVTQLRFQRDTDFYGN